MKTISIYDILTRLEKRKGLFLGNDYNFQSLEAFINGFTLAATDKHLTHRGCPHFNLFNLWIVGHLKKHFGQSGGWHWQISNRNPNNDEKAFKEFFMFLNRFKEARLKRKVLKLDKRSIEHHKKNRQYFETIDRKHTIVQKRPVKIILTFFSNSTTVLIDYVEKNGKIISSEWEANSARTINKLKQTFGDSMVFIKNE